jgi:pseudaminic acid synthase
MIKSFKIAGRKIGPGEPPYIIAEISGNHNGDINRAFQLIELAQKAGADAVKLQTFTADSLTLDTDRPEFTLKGGTWDGWNLHKLYETTHTPWDWHAELFAKARQVGITIFSSPFDKKAVAFLEQLDTPAYKIASNEFTDWPLVEAAAKTGKPLIMSTGTSSKEDVEATLRFVESCGIKDISILHCVSAYPAPPEDANIRTLDDIIASFNAIPGFSDHTLGIAASIAAVARGACVIEKHFTLSRADGGPDSTFSLEPAELETLCREARSAWASLGGIKYGGETNLKKKNIFTRQYWTVRAIKAGEILSEENIRSIRAPSDSGGIPTRHFREVLGLNALHDIAKHEPLRWDNLKGREEI